MTVSDKPISTYEPRKEAVGQLLSSTNPSIVVPDWQRNYSWQTEQIEAFWNDLRNFMSGEGNNLRSEYFLGSVVIVQTADRKLKLLDGQQRLATSAILLSVIRDKIRGYNENAAKQIQSDFLVGYDYVADKPIHKLRLNIYDREFFRKLILDPRDGDYVPPKPEISSHRLLESARSVFDNKLSSAVKDLSPQRAFEECMKISRCLLNNMTVIAVYSTDEDSAAEVFETLNDRGISLSTPDLLRNLIIRRAREEDRDQIIELWKDVVSFETDSLIKGYLRHYWVSRYGDVKTRSLYREIKSIVQKDDIDSLQLSASLSESAELYAQIGSAKTGSAKIDSLLSEINLYGGSSNILYPVILGILEVLDDVEAERAIALLQNVFVRHSVIVGLENSKLENAIYKAARELREKKDLERFALTVTAIAPNDEQTIDAFKRLAITHNGTRRNLLTRLERACRGTEEIDIASTHRVHVEHVYPQKPKPAERWENHNQMINRIGNLTLLSASFNKSIKNAGFEAKRPVFGKSELLITKALSTLPEWSSEAVLQRQVDFALQAPKLWPLQI